ncbi:hypothetical protein GGP41_000044 [Bipolaris sorokiniana]|uniref:HTH psq-type domain-containing protein n=1 Tax=Cochliobolus sativus TaxID=45130 RepID=A0A8H5ZBP9_COCSA|nr:hypothetical protein GGP41_000044 [Bipolaris sorokiniana]
MPRQQRSIQTSREGRISLAIASYRNNPKQSIRALAKAFDIPQSTLHTRIHGVQPRSETASVNRKLSPIEEQSLVQQGQQIAAEAERMVMEASQSQAGERRQRAPPTCTKCHVQGHTRISSFYYNNLKQSIYSLAKAYNVPKLTL